MEIEGRTHAYDLLECYRRVNCLTYNGMHKITGISIKVLRRGKPHKQSRSRGVHVLRNILRVTGGGFQVGHDRGTDLESDIAAWSQYIDYMCNHRTIRVDVMAETIGLNIRQLYNIIAGDIAEDQTYDGVGLLRTISRLYCEPVEVTGYPS